MNNGIFKIDHSRYLGTSFCNIYVIPRTINGNIAFNTLTQIPVYFIVNIVLSLSYYFSMLNEMTLTKKRILLLSVQEHTTPGLEIYFDLNPICCMFIFQKAQLMSMK